MAQFNRPHLVQTVAAPQHYAPPSAREMRAHAVHRLQIGLLGLAGMLLLVGLANIVMNRVRVGDAASAQSAAVSGPSDTESAKSDPLADIGVAPSTSPSKAAEASQSKR